MQGQIGIILISIGITIVVIVGAIHINKPKKKRPAQSVSIERRPEYSKEYLVKRIKQLERKSMDIEIKDEEISNLHDQIIDLEEAQYEIQKASAQKDIDFIKFRGIKEEEIHEYSIAAEGILSTLLDTVDSIDMAVSSLAKIAKTNDAQDGLMMIQRKILNSLHFIYDIEPIDATGAKFDPNFHEAIDVITTNKIPDGSVEKEIQRGYTMNGKIFRPTKVRVAQAPETNRQSQLDALQHVEDPETASVVDSFTRTCANCEGAARIVRVWSNGVIDYICLNCGASGRLSERMQEV